MTNETNRPVYIVAMEVWEDWGSKVNNAAVPYLSAMSRIDSMSDNYGMDSAVSVVSYFLANSGAWRGETARRVKAELRAMVKAERQRLRA